MATDGGGKSGQGGLSRTTNTDEHSATGISVDGTGETEQMREGIVEDDEGHLL